MKINIFDTPGFADSDIDQLRKNKLLIATSLRKDIHVVIFLTSNPRFDEAQQKLFQTLNDWTNGQIWSNVLYIKGRQLFDEESVRNMVSNNGLFS